jgi:hypothetical protein
MEMIVAAETTVTTTNSGSMVLLLNSIHYTMPLTLFDVLLCNSRKPLSKMKTSNMQRGQQFININLTDDEGDQYYKQISLVFRTQPYHLAPKEMNYILV